MNEAEYHALVLSERRGEVAIGIDRTFARRVYTDTPLSRLRELTGETPRVEKAIVFGAFLTSPVAALVSWALAVRVFGWWSILAIPIVGILWLGNKSESSLGGASMRFLTALLVAALAAIFVLPSRFWLAAFVLAAVLSLWTDRFVYSAATSFLRAFVLRNKRALEAFEDGVTIRR